MELFSYRNIPLAIGLCVLMVVLLLWSAWPILVWRRIRSRKVNPEKVDSTMANISSVYGLYLKICLAREDDREFERELFRGKLLENALQQGAKPDKNGIVSWQIKMSCGQTYHIPDILKLPLQDVPCTCGNPTHWFIKYEEETF